MIYSSLILFQNLAGISGDESDASRGLPVNLEVPPGLQVVPMSKHHEHGPADFSLSTSLHHHLLPTADDVRERLKVWANHLSKKLRKSLNVLLSFSYRVRNSSFFRWRDCNDHHPIWTSRRDRLWRSKPSPRAHSTDHSKGSCYVSQWIDGSPGRWVKFLANKKKHKISRHTHIFFPDR